MCVDAFEDTKEMGDNVQLSLWFALHLAVLTLYVNRARAPVNLVSKVTDTTAQTSTNVKSPERTSATRTPYARTRRDLMSVGV